MVSTPPSQYAPMTASYQPETKKIAQDAQGNWKFVDTNKNVHHANLNIKPALAGILESIIGKDLTGKHGLPEDFTKHKLGSTQGYEWGTTPPSFNPFKMFQKQQATIADINAMNKKAWDNVRQQKALEEKAKIDAQAAQATADAVIQQQKYPNQGKVGSWDPSGGQRGMGTDTPSGHAGDWGPGAKHGGLATMFTRRG